MRTFILSLISIQSIFHILNAQPGSFDPAFGENGVVITNVLFQNAYTSEIALTDDYKILSAGTLEEDSIFILRHDLQGKVDSSFGTNGLQTLSFIDGPARCTLIKDAGNGKFIVGGVVTIANRDQGFLVRMHNDGKVDSTFGWQGRIVWGALFGSSLQDAAVYPNGKVIAAGDLGFLGEQYIIVRYGSTGSPDFVFGTASEVLVDMFGEFDNPHSIYLLPDQKILVIGRSINLEVPLETIITALRLHPNGAIDNSFGDNGRQFLNLSDFENQTIGAIPQDDGSTLIGITEGARILALVKLDANGQLDSAYGEEGIVTHTFADAEYESAQSFIQGTDGRIVTAGIHATGNEFSTGLMRFNPDGSVDSTFGTAGRAIHNLGDSTEYWTDIAMLSQGRFLVAGDVYRDGVLQHVLAVVYADSSSTFAPVGAIWDHCLQPDIEPGQYHIRVEFTEATTFNGMICGVLRSDDFWKFGMNTVDSMLVCSEGDKVYYAEGDSLHILYDFSLQAGDTLVLRFPIEMNSYYQKWFPELSLFSKFLIEDVDTVMIDGVPLKRQHLFRLDDNPYVFVHPGDWAIERIGYEQWVFPFLSWGESNAACNLLEYGDYQIHVQDTTHKCMTLGTNDGSTSEFVIDVWPNPFHDRIFIESEERIQGMRLFGLDGKLLASTVDQSLDVSKVSAGIYVLVVVMEGRSVARKVVKQ